MAVVSGTTKNSLGAYESRTVRAIRCSDGALAGTAISINSTGAYSITALDTTPHDVIEYPVAFHPYWSKVSLLLHMDDTGLTDAKGHPVTLNGGVSRSSAHPAFGGYAASFDGSSGYLSLADHADFELGGGDFDIESRIYLTGYSAGYSGVYKSILVSKDVGTGREFAFSIGGTASTWTSLNFIGFSDNTNYTEVSGSFTFSLNTLYSVKVSRVGNLIYLFVNGALLNAGGTAFSRTIQDTTTIVTVGGQAFAGFPYYLPGHIDEFCLVKGVGINTANYTPLDIAWPHGYSGGTENAQIYSNVTPV